MPPVFPRKSMCVHTDTQSIGFNIHFSGVLFVSNTIFVSVCFCISRRGRCHNLVFNKRSRRHPRITVLFTWIYHRRNNRFYFALLFHIQSNRHRHWQIKTRHEKNDILVKSVNRIVLFYLKFHRKKNERPKLHGVKQILDDLLLMRFICCVFFSPLIETNSGLSIWYFFFRSLCSSL